MNRLVLIASLVLASSASARADDRVAVQLTRIPDATAWHYRMTLRSNESQEVVRDRRLLRLTVRPEGSRRRHRCTHPEAPRRVSEGRVASLDASEIHEEWIELRMYCWGRALRALESGNASIEVQYGFASRSRTRWIARKEDERRPPFRVDGPAIAWTQPTEVEPESTSSDESTSVELSVTPSTTRASWPLIRARIRGRGRVYHRDDLWSFVVRGPLGTVECRPRRQTVVPIIDFFRRLNRRGIATALGTADMCPEDTFEIEGVYEITPVIDLVYDGDAQGLDDVVTGTHRGSATPFRVLRRGAYVNQDVEELLRSLHPPAVDA